MMRSAPRLTRGEFIRLLILPGICLVMYLVWAFNLPMSLCPDESMRYLVPRYIVMHGALPLGSEAEVRDITWGFSYAYSPYGSSLLAVPFMTLAKLLSGKEVALVFGARCASALCGAATVLVCELIGRRVFSNWMSPYLMGGLCGLLPQFVFWSSYLNKEAYGVLCCALVIHAWLVGREREWSTGTCVWLGVCLGVLVHAYYHAYGYIIASIWVFFATQTKAGSGSARQRRRRALRGALIVSAIAIVLGGWFFARNLVLHGDLRGTAAMRALREQYAAEEVKLASRYRPASEGKSLLWMLFVPNEYNINNMTWFESVFTSFVGVFGYMALFLDTWVYACYAALLGVGIVLTLAIGGGRFGALKGLVLPILLAVAFNVVTIVWSNYTSDYSPQGRYFCSILVPLMMLVTCGYDALAQRLAERQERREQPRHLGGSGTQRQRARNLVPTLAVAIPLAIAVTLFCYVAVAVIIPNCTQGIVAIDIPYSSTGNNLRLFTYGDSVPSLT